MMKTREPSPPLMKACGTLKPVEPCLQKKSDASYPRGLPPPLLAEISQDSSRQCRFRLRRFCSLARCFRPVFDFQLFNTGKGTIVGDEDCVQRESVSANHRIEVPHRLALAFQRGPKLAILLGCV